MCKKQNIMKQTQKTKPKKKNTLSRRMRVKKIHETNAKDTNSIG